MRKTMLLVAGAGLVAALAGPAMAQDKKILAVVVKGLDNPFFTVMGQGCADWNAANPDSDYQPGDSGMLYEGVLWVLDSRCRLVGCDSWRPFMTGRNRPKTVSRPRQLSTIAALRSGQQSANSGRLSLRIAGSTPDKNLLR